MHRFVPIFILTTFIYGCVSPQARSLGRRPTSQSVYKQFAGLSTVVELNSPTDEDLKEIAGSGQDVWILGNDIVLRREDEAFKPIEIPGCAEKNFHALIVTSPEEVSLACTLENGKPARANWDGKTWSLSDDLKNVDPKVWRATPKDVWTLKEKGKVAHADGVLLETRTLSKFELNAISGFKIGSFENIWIVGDGGEVLFFDGVFWQDIISQTDEKLNSVWVDPSGTAWIAGSKGLILRSQD